MDAIDPTTEELIAEYDEHGSAEVERRLVAAAEAYAYWIASTAERCWSGRTGLPAKQLSGVNLDRGFESLPLRQSQSTA